MSAKPADFMVILRDDIHANNIALLSAVIRSFKLSSGLVANVLWCKSIRSSHGVYLDVEAKLTSGDGFSNIQIPHAMVLAIAGSKGSPPIGFVWAKETHKE